MKEKVMQTSIGDDVEVDIYFDVTPYEEQTHDNPGHETDIKINAVCINGDREQDILNELKNDTIESLEEDCLKYLSDLD